MKKSELVVALTLIYVPSLLKLNCNVHTNQGFEILLEGLVMLALFLFYLVLMMAYSGLSFL